MTTSIKAKVARAPVPLPIIQGNQTRLVKNGNVVHLTEEQFIGSLTEAPHLFQFHCPSCRQWYAMLYQLGKRRLCLHCIEWRGMAVSQDGGGGKLPHERKGEP